MICIVFIQVHPLTICAQYASVDVANFLLSRDDADTYISRADSQGRNMLHTCCEFSTKKHTELSDLLLRFESVPLNIPDSDGESVRVPAVYGNKVPDKLLRDRVIKKF